MRGCVSDGAVEGIGPSGCLVWSRSTDQICRCKAFLDSNEINTLHIDSASLQDIRRYR